MIVVVAGPTCSGKSSLAIKLAQALDAEIINGDAFQVYKYFDIGTAKPTLKERALVPHHLFDFVDPNTNFNVKDYQEIARKTISYLEDKKKNIIIVGGTGLYQKATLYDFSFDDENNHADMSDLALLSNEEVYEELKRIDEESTKTIHVNNRKRVLRAIEIYRLHCITAGQKVPRSAAVKKARSQRSGPFIAELTWCSRKSRRRSSCRACRRGPSS